MKSSTPQPKSHGSSRYMKKLTIQNVFSTHSLLGYITITTLTFILWSSCMSAQTFVMSSSLDDQIDGSGSNLFVLDYENYEDSLNQELKLVQEQYETIRDSIAVTDNDEKENTTRNNNRDGNIFLILLAIHEPQCNTDDESTNIIPKMEEAYIQLSKHFYKLILHHRESDNGDGLQQHALPPLPTLGTMDSTNITDEFLVDFHIQNHQIPSLTFLLVHQKEHNNENEQEEEEVSESSTTSTANKSAENIIQTIEYIGSQETSKDIADAVLHYWYRFVYHDYISNDIMYELILEEWLDNNEVTDDDYYYYYYKTPGEIETDDEEEDNGNSNDLAVEENTQKEDEEDTTDAVNSNGDSKNEDISQNDKLDFVEILPNRPIFPFTSMQGIHDFVHTHGKSLFHSVSQDLSGIDDSKEEVDYIETILGTRSRGIKDESNSDDEKKSDDLRDPFTVFIQFRSPIASPVEEEGEDTEEESLLSNAMSIHSLFQEFNDIAETFIFRRDVAFFTIISKNLASLETHCNEFGITTEETFGCNGSIRVLKLTPPQSNDDRWQGFSHDELTTGPLWEAKQLLQKETNLDMTQFAVTQSTPTILYFDHTTSASIAFPIYRKVHCILFVDMHTARAGKFSSTNASSISSQNRSIYAIRMLQEAALHHRQSRPREDMVFLIVPSTELHILKTFGIDIWTEVHELCSDPYQDTNCELKDGLPKFPMVMITSRRESPTTMFRYFLQSEDILHDGADLTKDTNKIQSFISDYYDEKLKPFFRSEPPPPPPENQSSSGVRIVTGNTFEDMIMKNSSKHSLIQFYTPTCGHCKRFSMIWNKLPQIITQMNWTSQIDILKMDISQNEVVHESINIHNVPAVFLFPHHGQKDDPFVLRVEGDDEPNSSNVGGISDPVLIIEWMISLLQQSDKVQLIELTKGAVD